MSLNVDEPTPPNINSVYDWDRVVSPVPDDDNIDLNDDEVCDLKLQLGAFVYSEGTQGRNYINYKRKCFLKCLRCLSMNPAKPNKPLNQCGMVACFGMPYCNKHLRQKMNLHLETERKGGNHLDTRVHAFIGIYTHETKIHNPSITVFATGAPICEITGEILNLEQIQRRHGQMREQHPFVINIENDRFVDASCSRGIWATIRKSSNQNETNCNIGEMSMHTNPNNPVWAIIASRVITHYEELVCYKPNLPNNLLLFKTGIYNVAQRDKERTGNRASEHNEWDRIERGLPHHYFMLDGIQRNVENIYGQQPHLDEANRQVAQANECKIEADDIVKVDAREGVTKMGTNKYLQQQDVIQEKDNDLIVHKLHKHNMILMMMMKILDF